MDKKDKKDFEAQELIQEVRSRVSELDYNGEDLLFRAARSFNGWAEKNCL